MQRAAVVVLTLEYDDTKLSSPEEWDWDAIVNYDHTSAKWTPVLGVIAGELKEGAFVVAGTHTT